MTSRSTYEELEQIITEQQRTISALDTLVKTVPAMICIVSPEGDFEYLNPEWEKVLGYSLEYLLSKSIFDLLHPGDHAAMHKKLESQLKKESTVHLENRFLSEEGSYKILEWRVAPLKEGRLYCAVKDVTARKRKEDELNKNNYLLNATAQILKVGGWSWDVQFQELNWTEETYNIHGFNLDNGDIGALGLINRSLECYDLKDRSTVFSAFRQCADNGIPYDFELPFTQANGSKLWVRTVGKPVFNGDKIVKVVGNIFDITERKQYEEALLTAKKQWEETFDAVTDWVTIIDRNHTILRSNLSSDNFFNLSAKQVLGKKCYDIVGNKTCLVPDCPLDRAVKSKKREEMEIQLDDGRWILITVDPIKNGSNGEHYVHIVRDVSRLKTEEKQIIAARKAEAFSVLFGGIAHDYNNLLTVIWGNISLLREEISNAAQRDFFDMAELACAQARSLTHQFIMLSKGFALQKSSYPVADILKSGIGWVSVSPDVEITLDIPDPSPTIELDFELFGIALRNLLSNAIEAMPDGGKLHIAVSTCFAAPGNTAGAEYLQIAFKDTGRGIDQGDLSDVYDPYFTTKDLGSQRGSGLGLAVAQSIIKKHSGDIQISSDPGYGTTVTILLPFAVPGHQATPAPQSKKPTILLMEDDQRLKKMCKQILQRMNFQVITADHKDECVQVYNLARKNNTSIDLMFLGQNITNDAGGSDTLRDLRRLGYTNKAVVISGSPDNPIVLDYKKFGFDGNLLKPFSKEELETVVRRFATQ